MFSFRIQRNKKKIGKNHELLHKTSFYEIDLVFFLRNLRSFNDCLKLEFRYYKFLKIVFFILNRI